MKIEFTREEIKAIVLAEITPGFDRPESGQHLEIIAWGPIEKLLGPLRAEIDSVIAELEAEGTLCQGGLSIEGTANSYFTNWAWFRAESINPQAIHELFDSLGQGLRYRVHSFNSFTILWQAAIESALKQRLLLRYRGKYYTCEVAYEQAKADWQAGHTVIPPAKAAWAGYEAIPAP